MERIFTVLMLLLFALSVDANSKVRRVEVKTDQIVQVRTSLGIATIIQVPDRPNSVVVGDQDSFKVEYLDQAITIKPLRSGAKTNLYIYTDWRRYNVELVSGSESSSDYVVYLENVKIKPVVVSKSLKKTNEIKWTSFIKTLKNDDLALTVKRLGVSTNGILLVEFFISSLKKINFRPEWLWLSQGGVSIPIHNLHLSNLSATPNQNIGGVILLRREDVDSKTPIRLEMRRTKVSYMTVSSVVSWKK